MAWRVYLETLDYAMEHKLYLIRANLDGSQDMVLPMTLKRFAPEMMLDPDTPFLAGRKDDVTDMLRAIMEQAWEMGIRPAGYEPITGELRATKAHLEDMRRLAKVPGATPKEPA